MNNIETDNLKTSFKNKKNNLLSIIVIIIVVVLCCLAIWYFSNKATNEDNKNNNTTTTTTTTTTIKIPYTIYDKIELKDVKIEEVKELYGLIEKGMDKYNLGDLPTNLYAYPTSLSNMSYTIKMWFVYSNLTYDIKELDETDLINLDDETRNKYAKISINFDTFINEIDRIFGPSVTFLGKTIMPINSDENTKLAYNVKAYAFEAYINKEEITSNKTIVKNVYKATKNENNEIEIYLAAAFNENKKSYSDADYKTEIKKYITEDNILDNLDSLAHYKITYTLDTDQKYHFDRIEKIEE